MSTESLQQASMADVSVLCGDIGLIDRNYCAEPFAPEVIEFCAKLSERLLASASNREYPDLATFGFYCRKANLTALQDQLALQGDRLGWGRALHIAPSNIPVNFAYSFLFGLLAGNSNLVRVPSRNFPQIPLLCEHLQALFNEPDFKSIAAHNAFVSFPRDSDFLADHIERFDALLIWGGDETVTQIRSLPRSPRCVEVAFSDRYSFAMLDANAVNGLSESDLEQLCLRFYNDTYLVDQNACSSPSLVIWQGESAATTQARARFWPALQRCALARYGGNAVQVMDKQILLFRYLERFLSDCRIEDFGGLVTVATLDSVPQDNHRLKGAFGLFFELESSDIFDVLPVINKKYQTLTYFGLDPQVIKNNLFSNRCAGIDRVVPVGSALDIGVHWDGYDLVRTLSRIIAVR